MNILFCYGNWMNPNRGGVQRVSDTLAKYFVSKGHKLFYLSHNYDANDNYLFPATIYHLPNNDFYSDININYYHKLLNELSIEIIINHDASNSRSKFWLNSGMNNIKRISLYHTDPLYGINQFKGLSKYIGNKYIETSFIKSFSIVFRYVKIHRKKKEIRFLLKNSERLVFLSEEFKKQILNELKISSSKISTISNPVVLNTYRNSFVKKKQILFVARFELSVKRHDLILKVWSILHDKYLDWELIFLGDGPDRTTVEDMARYMNLKNVRFEGFVNPDPYYSEASIISMTSDYEGFGLVLLEAMQYGVVPIAFNNWVSLKDIILDEHTGILVDSGDLTGYSKKLEKLIFNDVFRNHLAENAIEYVKRFQIEAIGPKWLKLFNELLKV